MKLSLRLAAVFLSVLFGLEASAARLSLVGAGSLAMLTTNPADTTSNGVALSESKGSSSLGLGGGALLGFRVAMMTELETGALYLTHKYSTTTTATVLNQSISQADTFTLHALQIPLLLRFHFARFFSIGVGGYAALGMGKIKDESTGELANNGVATPTTTNQTYAEAGMKTKDFGLLGSAAIHFPIGMGWGFVFDGRYAFGLSDQNANPGETDPAVVEKSRDIELLAGLQFHL